MPHVRMDTEIRRRATAALAGMGADGSPVVLPPNRGGDQAFRLELKVPKAETRRAMAESEEMMMRGTARFASADEMLPELEEVD